MNAATISAYASVGTFILAVAGLVIVLIKLPFELYQSWYGQSDRLNQFLWDNPEIYKALFHSKRQGVNPPDPPVDQAKIDVACAIILDALERIALAVARGVSEGPENWRRYIKRYFDDSEILQIYLANHRNCYTKELRNITGLRDSDMDRLTALAVSSNTYRPPERPNA